MQGLFEITLHNYYLNIIKKLKGVKGAIYVKTASKPPKFYLNVTVMNDKVKQVIRYNLDGEPSENSEEIYLFIINDLKKKGYGK